MLSSLSWKHICHLRRRVKLLVSLLLPPHLLFYAFPFTEFLSLWESSLFSRVFTKSSSLLLGFIYRLWWFILNPLKNTTTVFPPRQPYLPPHQSPSTPHCRLDLWSFEDGFFQNQIFLSLSIMPLPSSASQLPNAIICASPWHPHAEVWTTHSCAWI